MTLKDRLKADLEQALKARDTRRVSCIRMLRARLLEREVALRAKHGRDYSIADDEALEAVASYAKQRRDSIDSFRQGGRPDLAAEEEAELGIVASYLPAQLGPEELRRIVAEAVRATGASGPRDVGAVMRAVMPQLKGAADGKLVQQIVREALGAG